MHGLFEVTEGIDEVRGRDLSNVSLIEATPESGSDALISKQTAAAELALSCEHRGDRPGTPEKYCSSGVLRGL